MEKSQIEPRLIELEKNIKDSCKKIELENLKSKMLAFEAEMNIAGFWDDQGSAQKVIQEYKKIKFLYETWAKLLEEIDSLKSLFIEIEDHDLNTFEDELGILEKEYNKASYILYFNGKYDNASVLMTITSGVGGDDAEDFTGMLLRMYKMYFENKGFEYSLLEINEGAGENGIKRATLEIKGLFAYGTLKGEKGVHRLVRLSPFKSNDSRQTSFAHVEIMPLFEDFGEENIVIEDEDLRIDTFRASGHGGQKVNKTDSAVRITHLPTGLSAACQAERSQLQNKERAMMILKSKLYQRKLDEREKERKDVQGEVILEDWGKQIRSYVLHPYKMVKDHRTDVEVSNPDKVFDGELDEFIDAEIKRSIS